MISVVVRTRTQKEEDECAWREAILEEESQGDVEVRRATPLDPEAMVSVPFVLRPTLVIPKPGQPDKRRFIVNLSWECALAERGLRGPLAPNSYTYPGYFYVAEWMSCSMGGEAIAIASAAGKLVGLAPYVFFRDMKDWFCQWQLAMDERWKGAYLGPEGSTVIPRGTQMGASTGSRNCEKVGHAASAEKSEKGRGERSR